MAKIDSITVDVVANVELVNLQCRETACAHNLRNKGKLRCNLKHVVMAKGAVCANYQEKVE